MYTGHSPKTTRMEHVDKEPNADIKAIASGQLYQVVESKQANSILGMNLNSNLSLHPKQPEHKDEDAY